MTSLLPSTNFRTLIRGDTSVRTDKKGSQSGRVVIQRARLTTQYRGHGRDLSICRSIMEAHGVDGCGTRQSTPRATFQSAAGNADRVVRLRRLSRPKQPGGPADGSARVNRSLWTEDRRLPIFHGNGHSSRGRHVSNLTETELGGNGGQWRKRGVRRKMTLVGADSVVEKSVLRTSIE